MFQSHGQQLGVWMTFHFLRPSDFMKTMCATNDFTRLLGDKSLADSRKTLSLFWSRYREHQPLHDVFTNKNHCLDRCVPMYVHGDEGQTYKKKAVLIISFQFRLWELADGIHPMNIPVVPQFLLLEYLWTFYAMRYKPGTFQQCARRTAYI